MKDEMTYLDYLEGQVNSLRRSWSDTASELRHAKEDKELYEIELARIRDILLRKMNMHKKRDHPSLDDPLKVTDLLREFIVLDETESP